MYECSGADFFRRTELPTLPGRNSQKTRLGRGNARGDVCAFSFTPSTGTCLASSCELGRYREIANFKKKLPTVGTIKHTQGYAVNQVYT